MATTIKTPMSLHMQVEVYRSQVEVIAEDANTLTVRTKDIIPFWGDYAVTTVVLNPEEQELYAKHKQDVTDSMAWLSQYDIDSIMDKACRAIGKQLTDYVIEQLRCQCVNLGNAPFTDTFTR